ncbi:hypothetical protein MD588_06150 [Photobacterium sp. SDRW27]|uniref:hypothetical protein n=1 Tax=Photobacterium obscurum TaxID=2829490 RepID=UPI002243E0E1|nr:hypothetical protein [Photobacterium obscurum]MCW8328386.1 hypothetical protein [Photobacterium obscurum]
MKSRSNHKKATIGYIIGFVISLALFKLDVLGMLPALFMVLSFFMTLIHGWLYLSGQGEKGDIYDAVLDANRTKSKALVSGMDMKDESKSS